ncbi:MAG: DUF1801 domain-containing protein [Pyrinomonadaceae bacterium]|nr:DUF1801 domain-containing protein [Sphingobacteriaceae bacterium]
MKELDNFYHLQEEPIKSCFLALRKIILDEDPDITHVLKYGMPFFCYKGKMFCYLWIHKKYKQPYLGLVEGKRLDHRDLIVEKRSRMKIMLLDPEKDLPLKTIRSILATSISFYKTGEIKLR